MEFENVFFLGLEMCLKMVKHPKSLGKVTQIFNNDRNLDKSSKNLRTFQTFLFPRNSLLCHFRNPDSDVFSYMVTYYVQRLLDFSCWRRLTRVIVTMQTNLALISRVTCWKMWNEKVAIETNTICTFFTSRTPSFTSSIKASNVSNKKVSVHSSSVTSLVYNDLLAPKVSLLIMLME